MIKNFFKKITGIKTIEDAKLQAAAELAVAEKLTAQALAATARAKEEEELAKMSPKERATLKGEAWVAVLDTHVNKDNIRNGFFELDWNDKFVEELKTAGYGFDGDPEEEIVDRWFRDLARNMLAEEGIDSNRGAGFININKITKNQSEAS